MTLGLTDTDPAAVARTVLVAWADTLDAAKGLAGEDGLDRPSRLPGWTGRDICIHLGLWPDQQPLADILASARSGAPGTSQPPDRHNAAVLAAHRGADDATVLGALEASRDSLARWLDSPDFAREARLPGSSILGPMPALTIAHAGTFELAVHGLDLATCGARPPGPELLDAGLAALVDVTGCLAARTGVRGRLALRTPEGGWWTATRPGEGWTAGPVTGPAPDGVVVDGEPATLLDAAAGRTNALHLFATRRVRVHDLAGLLAFTPLLDAAPNLPGGPALRLAAKGVAGVGGAVGRVFGAFGRG